MNLWRLKSHLIDSKRADGDVLFVDITDAAACKTFKEIIKDKSLCTALFEVDTISFALIQSQSITPELLNAVWIKMTYGSTIFFTEYMGTDRGSDRIIKAFIDEHADDITLARQMLIGGIKEKNLIVKCFQQKKKQPPLLNDGTITVATVFKSGGPDFTVDDVNHIANSIKANTTLPYKFICISDQTAGFCDNVDQVIPFDHDFPKWWGKMELFKTGKFNTDKVFYVDLDTLIIDNIDDILRYGGKFFALRDFYHQAWLGSGILCWETNNPQLHDIYTKFIQDSNNIMASCSDGDQQFIYQSLNGYGDYIQDLYPKAVVSYKHHCLAPRDGIHIPPWAKIICFHGPPRPKSIHRPEIRKYWMG